MLKNLLDQSGISYMQALKRLRTPETVAAYDPDQGARIIHPEVITPKMALNFDDHSNYDQLMNEMIDKAALFAKVFKKYI